MYIPPCSVYGTADVPQQVLINLQYHFRIPTLSGSIILYGICAPSANRKASNLLAARLKPFWHYLLAQKQAKHQVQHSCNFTQVKITNANNSKVSHQEHSTAPHLV